VESKENGRDYKNVTAPI